MNDEGVYRNAPATPCLLTKMNFQNISSHSATLVSQDSLTNHVYQKNRGVQKLLKAIMFRTILSRDIHPGDSQSWLFMFVQFGVGQDQFFGCACSKCKCTISSCYSISNISLSSSISNKFSSSSIRIIFSTSCIRSLSFSSSQTFTVQTEDGIYV